MGGVGGVVSRENTSNYEVMFNTNVLSVSLNK